MKQMVMATFIILFAHLLGGASSAALLNVA
jgi:hypothetical protein